MKTKLVAIAAAAVAIIPLTGSPTTAAAAAGTITFECVANLPQFPSRQAEGTCGAYSPGAPAPAGPSTATGVMAGTTDSGQPFVLAAIPTTNNFFAEFTYFEPCIAGEPPVTGQANGTAEISNLQGVVGTTPVNGGTLTVGFTWIRGGGTAAIIITDATLSFGETITGTTVAGAGSASFAPVLQADNLCPVGGDLRAVVQGSAAVGATS